MLYETNTNNPKGKSNTSLESYRFSLSNQHCVRGVYILTGVTERRQESESHTIERVFQLLLAGIVPRKEYDQ